MICAILCYQQVVLFFCFFVVCAVAAGGMDLGSMGLGLGGSHAPAGTGNPFGMGAPTKPVGPAPGGTGGFLKDSALGKN